MLMRKILVFSIILLFCVSGIYGQQKIQNARLESWQSLIYKISADTAEKYIKHWNIDIDIYLQQAPFRIEKKGFEKLELLPPGNYIIVSTKQTELVAQYYCKSNVTVMPINDQLRLQFELRDTLGKTAVRADAWLNNKKLKFNTLSQTYSTNIRRADEAILKVVAAGDTSFFELTALENITKSYWNQWWTNLYNRKPIYTLSTPVRLVKKILTNNYYSGNRFYRKVENGYVIFNQPKYKPGDTLRTKAYIVTKKGKPYKKSLNLVLNYYSYGEAHNKQLTKLSPVSPGAYIYDFVLGDFLDADRDYNLHFKNKKDQIVMSGNFKIEDYLLDEVATYALRSEKENYYQKDTLLFYGNAKDANGLALMDGKVRLYLVAKSISEFYHQQVLVPDTLWQQEKPLLVEGDTKFEIPTSALPDANIDIEVTAEFRNSNNEIQEEEITVKLVKNPAILKVEQEAGYITAGYFMNGISVYAKGKLSYGGDDMERDISFPFKEKINPFVEEYKFWIEDKEGKVIASDFVEIEKNAEVIFSRVQSGDSAGFSLYNPLSAQVHYSVLFGNEIIASGSDTAENITWVSKLPAKKIYTAVWNYNWGGKEYKGSNSIALLSKLLHTSIDGAANIYPGQKDTITINVQDYKNRPAEAVNITAVSYNSQFNKDIKVPEPPYQQKYKYRNRILMDDFELETVGFTSKKTLGDHQQWTKLFGLDTMQYYQFLFPEGGKQSASQLIHDFVPQLSVHVVKKGLPQEIYLLYINRELVWYNSVTDKSNYAFTTPPGYAQIGFRLKNKYIEIDSVYIQPYYKHDIVFDLDQLPALAKVYEREETYTYLEQLQLEKQLFRIANDPKTNGGFIWQNNQLVKLAASKSHIVGPFKSNDSLQFFKPDAFDLKFSFEPAYEYTLTPTMERLEKKPLFAQKSPVKLPVIKNTAWILGDTVPALPVIQYTTKYTPPYLLANDYYYTTNHKSGTVSIQLPADSNFAYAILYSIAADSNVTRIKNYQLARFSNVDPGKYNLILVTKNLHFVEVENIIVAAKTTTCIKIDSPVYTSGNLFAEVLHLNQLNKPVELTVTTPVKDTTYTPVISGLPMPKGNASIAGVVTDKQGKSPIPGTAVMFMGYNSGTTTDANGYFLLESIQSGMYTIVISSVGYETKALQVSLVSDQTTFRNIELNPSESALQEVVVVGYGIQKRKSSLAYSTMSVRSEVISTLQGKLAGVQISDASTVDSTIIIRGVSSLSGDTKPLYVINGVVMDELPEGMELDSIRINVLKGEMATSLYGSRATNGVIIINTAEFVPKTLRENFKDYAIWQPNLITNKEGKVQFVATYPDNITSWQTYIVGMDKKGRITKTSTIVKSFKPMLAQLAMPQFLIEGDSAMAIGKLINYTTSQEEAKVDFNIGDSIVHAATYQLRAKEAINEKLPLLATGDTIKAQYNLQLKKGYADGELRKIPVYKKGTEEAKGIFSILNADTAITFTPDPTAGNTVIYIQDNPLDVLLDELKFLKDYPYYCMEQTASKLTGLLLEKQIKKTLQQPFKEEKQVQQLLGKLQKAQLFNGGWSWWPRGEVNIPITNYITRALLPLRDETLVKTNLRNATLYLQQLLPGLKENELPDVLYTLSEAGHVMDYTPYLQKLRFDSLRIHQQWLIIAVKQKQQLSYKKEWQVVMGKKIETMLGGIHWGEDSYYWDRNAIATTVLAFHTLEQEKGYEAYSQKIIQFFLERRTNGRWRNTVESASICAAILPMVLQQQPKYNVKPMVNIKAGETISVKQFPYVTTITNHSKPIEFTKQGGGIMYITAWQKIFNPYPQPVTNNFIVNSSFEKAGNTITVLQAGEKATMKVTVNALKDADYVLLEIPIPAGCTYTDKPQGWNAHKEFLKDKVIVFVERMPKGKYEYTIELEPRYSGKYHLNPVKTELMYFATFYGRNEMKQVEITP